MNYPFWDLPVGYGILMAIVAVIHVFISHFAIGGGLFLVVFERAARKSGDTFRLEFLERLSRFFVLVTLVGGALTGVGIWFIIGLLNPAATEVLIHTFVWAWAVEWTFFVVEILAAILYYYGWKRMPAAAHMTIGWIYFLFAWLSLFAINGILTFMLTPGAWLQTGNFWDGFFNPTFWPSLVLRTAIAAALAGLYGLFVAARLRPHEGKARIVRQTARWGALGVAAAIPLMHWYWKTIPAAVTATAMQSMPIPMLSLQISFWLAIAVLVSVILFGIILPRNQHLFLASLTLAAGLGWVGSFEWFRESIRKPYIITGYMYGNGIKISDTDTIRQNGYLASIGYHSGDDGADLFRHACRSCHAIRGYNSMRRAFNGTDRAFIAALIKAPTMLKGNMPPFLGSDAEADAIARYIDRGLDKVAPAALPGLQGEELGKRIFDMRCGKCHTTGTIRKISDAIVGLTEENYNAMLDNAAILGAGMPAFTGDETERRALIAYFKTLKSEAK
jgi:mono/diheme cytochrome c family protein/cytochrome bd-type quinol oxidase subunit 1